MKWLAGHFLLLRRPGWKLDYGRSKLEFKWATYVQLIALGLFCEKIGNESKLPGLKTCNVFGYL